MIKAARFANTRLRDTAREVCDKAGIDREQQTNILRLFRDDKEDSPNPADAVVVRDKLDALWAALHGGEAPVEITTPARDPAFQPDPTPENVEQARLAAEPAPRRPGRPPIPASRKIAALQAKNEGKSNRDCAKILYNEPYPSESRVRNVWNIFTRISNLIQASRPSSGLQRLYS